VPLDERSRPAKYLVVFLRREVAPVQRECDDRDGKKAYDRKCAKKLMRGEP
jgi:hypothetical protein